MDGKKLNRSNFKVAVSGKKQAKQFKQALLAIGEKISEHYRGDYPDKDQDQLVFCNNAWVCDCGHDDINEEITFKELLTLLVNDTQAEPVKPGLLDGNCAIQVNNEREFKLLMEHFHDKKWLTDKEFDYLKLHGTPEYWTYNSNPYRPIKSELEGKGFSFIPFADFAAEAGIKVPVFVMRSVDCVDLYEGDESHWVINVNPVHYLYPLNLNNAHNIMLHSGNDSYRLFSTKQAAEKWIAEQNKPKELECKLFGNKTAYIKQDCIDIDNGEIMFTIYPSDLEDMLHIYKQAYN